MKKCVPHTVTKCRCTQIWGRTAAGHAPRAGPFFLVFSPSRSPRLASRSPLPLFWSCFIRLFSGSIQSYLRSWPVPLLFFLFYFPFFFFSCRIHDMPSHTHVSPSPLSSTLLHLVCVLLCLSPLAFPSLTDICHSFLGHSAVLIFEPPPWLRVFSQRSLCKDRPKE